MDKTAIRNFAIEARKLLMKSAITEAGFYGITKDGCKTPIQKGNDFEVYETLTGTENRIYGNDIKRRANLVKAIEQQGFDQVIEEIAYTWFNRIIAIRFMEVNNYLPTRVRVLSSETGSGTPDIIAQVDTVELNLTADELDKIQTAKRENKYDEAFRILFIKQCNELNDILPGLFEKTNDYMELLLKITYTGDGVVRMLVDTIPEDNFNVETEGQVEIIGWMYQFYNIELKKEIESQKERVSKNQVPAKTQLFTPDWVVGYMVENSIGKAWIEHLLAENPTLKEAEVVEKFDWKYYLPTAEQEPLVAERLSEYREKYKSLKPQDLECIDPCMGSGHILVYMFDVLMDIYLSEGYSERDAVFEILENNIRGIDIDKRAFQLSYFALMMKARGYNRVFFRGKQDMDGNRKITCPEVFCIEESNTISRNQLKYFGKGLGDQRGREIEEILDIFRDAKEYGSLLSVAQYNWNELEQYINEKRDDGQVSFEMVGLDETQNKLRKIISIAKLLSKKYIVVSTNPPYMGMNYGSQKLNNFVKINYPNTKSDLFAVFIERCRDMLKPAAYQSMITMQSWMFLSSYKKMRDDLQTIDIESLIHLGPHAFEDLGGEVVQTVAFTFRNINVKDYISVCNRLVDVPNAREKEKAYLGKVGRYYSKKSSFEKIPARPYAYWISDAVLESFEKDNLSSLAEIVSGMTTGNNDLYLKSWAEVDFSKIAIGYLDMSKVNLALTNWIPYHKGGEQRKWYGNIEYVVNWSQSGKFNRAKTTMTHVYLKPCITWSDISGTNFAGRFCEGGFLFDVKGSCAFGNTDDLKLLMGIFNSKITPIYIEALNPTTTTQVGDLKRIPFIRPEKDVETEILKLVNENISISRDEWNDYEFSWDFKVNPLLGIYRKEMKNNEEIALESCFNKWKELCISRKQKILQNEEALNELVISVYGLNNELDKSVSIDDINIRDADEYREIVGLLSYAVGCMFGRYSLDYEGLCFAGGEWDDKKYITFIPESDAIIPITDEEYFDDDIVKRTIEFLEKAFGKKYLAENMSYIARILGNKGDSEKETIRKYFINDFYKDHCNMYSVTNGGKRPIYWMLSSGDTNGLKALFYIQRYSENTIGKIRSDYFVRVQSAIENSLKNVEYSIAASVSAVDKALATKQRDKYIKQLNELRGYYSALSHIALQRIEIDLDDGVKENYRKFQGIEVENEGEKKQTIDLLAKI